MYNSQVCILLFTHHLECTIKRAAPKISFSYPNRVLHINFSEGPQWETIFSWVLFWLGWLDKCRLHMLIYQSSNHRCDYHQIIWLILSDFLILNNWHQGSVNILQRPKHSWKCLCNCVNIHAMGKALPHAQTLNVYAVPSTFKIQAFGKAWMFTQLHRHSMNFYAFAIC